MTEAEAKSKWCPYAAGDAIAQERSTAGGNRFRCIGSACMAWRTSTKLATLPADKDGECPVSTTREDGHCGLAGKP